MQILKANAKVNAQGEPNRKVAIWDEFAHRIKQTTTVKEFCEVIFASVLPSADIKPEQLLKLARVANIQIAHLDDLDQMKQYLIDAIKTYQSQEADLVDKAIAIADAAKAALAQAKAFAAFKKKLIKKLKSGELIRPGSASRRKLSDLAAQMTLIDGNTCLQTLGGIIGNKLIPAGLTIDDKDIKEIGEVLKDALDLDLPPVKTKDNVLHITGRNIFLSQIKTKIENSLAANPGIQDIHIVGVHVYVDTSITIKGMNLALGGEYLEFIKDADNHKLKIDLTGKDGTPGAEVPSTRAQDARNNNENGANGAHGNDGDGGFPGGDFCINAKKVVGLEPPIIKEINLSGGTGGMGSNGQPGGNGANAIPGNNARTSIQNGDPADSSWGYVDIRRGGRSTPGTDGGEGGDCGLGGKGGAAGNLLIEKGAEAIRSQVKTDKGGEGGDGNPGAGGKGGTGAPDGLDQVYVKGGGWLFSGGDGRSGYGLQHRGGSDRKGENWHDTITKEETITRSQGKDKSNTKGKEASAHTRLRKDHQKKELKRQVFNQNLARHLHAEGSAARKYAFDAVTNKQALAHETEQIAAEQLASKQKKMKDIETLLKATTTLLSQTQTQQQAQTEHTRAATFTKKEKKINQGGEILNFLRTEAADRENKLPFREFCPVVHEKVVEIHEVEYALHEVNMTKARHMPAIANLLRKLSVYSKNPKCNGDKYNKLTKKLYDIIQKASIRTLSNGFNELLEVYPDLQKKEPEVKAFLGCVEEQSKGVQKAYEGRIHELRISKAILNFIANDRLFLELLTREMDEKTRAKKTSWFKQRQDQRIYDIFKIVCDREPTPDELVHFVHYADEMIKQIKAHFVGKTPTFKTMGKFLSGSGKIYKKNIKH